MILELDSMHRWICSRNSVFSCSVSCIFTISFFHVFTCIAKSRDFTGKTELIISVNFGFPNCCENSNIAERIVSIGFWNSSRGDVSYSDDLCLESQGINGFEEERFPIPMKFGEHNDASFLLRQSAASYFAGLKIKLSYFPSFFLKESECKGSVLRFSSENLDSSSSFWMLISLFLFLSFDLTSGDISTSLRIGKLPYKSVAELSLCRVESDSSNLFYRRKI